MKLSIFGALIASLCLSSGRAHAQLEEDLIPPTRSFVSPERFAVEFRAGAYVPDAPEFEAFFDDLGPLLEIELDYLALRVPDILYVGVGASIGMSNYSAGALTASGQRTDEESSFDILPISFFAVARVDALPRLLSIPFIFTGKLGYSWAHWTTETGGIQEAGAWSHGFRWAAQLGLDLDTFEPAAARALDEEWGINHSFAFFELWGFVPGGESLDIGDTSWTAGLGFIF